MVQDENHGFNEDSMSPKVLPDCTCKCCTAEPCLCESAELICETDKRPECDQWVGKNFEVSAAHCGHKKGLKSWLCY